MNRIATTVTTALLLTMGTPMVAQAAGQPQPKPSSTRVVPGNSEANEINGYEHEGDPARVGDDAHTIPGIPNDPNAAYIVITDCEWAQGRQIVHNERACPTQTKKDTKKAKKVVKKATKKHSKKVVKVAKKVVKVNTYAPSVSTQEKDEVQVSVQQQRKAAKKATNPMPVFDAGVENAFSFDLLVSQVLSFFAGLV